MFNPTEAIELLEENRKRYIDKLSDHMQRTIELNEYGWTTDYIISAADNLRSLTGALDYLTTLKKMKEAGNEDDYPELATILE